MKRFFRKHTFLTLTTECDTSAQNVAEHVASVKAKKTTTSYFSPRIQNELSELLGQKVRNEILSNVREAKYYSVLFDCTPDASHKEQMTQIIRYVHITEETCTIEESFVDFIGSHEKTGKGLAAEIIEKLEKDGLSISDCRGQGYDNGANKSGKYNGVQAHIRSLNEFARFVPCAAHTLNLVGVHAAEVSPLMITFFGKVQAIFNFFSSSTLRWEKLMKTLTISLREIVIQDAKKNERTEISIQNLRDVGVDNIIKAAAETAIQIGIEGDFPMKIKRKVKQMALYEAEDDFCRLSPETDFGSQCSLVFDSILTQIEWRFEAMSAVSSDFDFLSGHSLSKSSVDELKTKAKNLLKIYKADLDSSDFQSETASFKYQAAAMMENFEKSSPMDILQLIHKYSLTDAYPNTAIAIRIFLTLPVTVATCERSFSKLKTIKNYLRSTMGQERLSCLAVVSIEHEVANALDFDDVISDFIKASKKARKVTLN
ncbi:zinc finger MYM-type protein 1-like [Hydra vulgaris]|uniref:Zinc finger MYM-type protein 1-like n=1 Tax=Hydra vulgaris TaxID=6087 RepID=A0ABM4C9E8_HYDVU